MAQITITINVEDEDFIKGQANKVSNSACWELAGYLDQFEYGYSVSHINTDGVQEDWEN